MMVVISMLYTATNCWKHQCPGDVQTLSLQLSAQKKKKATGKMHFYTVHQLHADAVEAFIP